MCTAFLTIGVVAQALPAADSESGKQGGGLGQKPPSTCCCQKPEGHPFHLCYFGENEADECEVHLPLASAWAADHRIHEELGTTWQRVKTRVKHRLPQGSCCLVFSRSAPPVPWGTRRPQLGSSASQSSPGRQQGHSFEVSAIKTPVPECPFGYHEQDSFPRLLPTPGVGDREMSPQGST